MRLRGLMGTLGGYPSTLTRADGYPRFRSPAYASHPSTNAMHPGQHFQRHPHNIQYNHGKFESFGARPEGCLWPAQPQNVAAYVAYVLIGRLFDLCSNNSIDPRTTKTIRGCPRTSSFPNYCLLPNIQIPHLVPPNPQHVNFGEPVDVNVRRLHTLLFTDQPLYSPDRSLPIYNLNSL